MTQKRKSTEGPGLGFQGRLRHLKKQQQQQQQQQRRLRDSVRSLDMGKDKDERRFVFLYFPNPCSVFPKINTNVVFHRYVGFEDKRTRLLTLPVRLA